MNMSHGDCNFFRSLLENYPYRYSTVGLCLAMISVIVPMFYSIIWYERFGSDKKRTIINQLVSEICWNAIFGCITVQTLASVRSGQSISGKKILGRALFCGIYF